MPQSRGVRLVRYLTIHEWPDNSLMVLVIVQTVFFGFMFPAGYLPVPLGWFGIPVATVWVVLLLRLAERAELWHIIERQAAQIALLESYLGTGEPAAAPTPAGDGATPHGADCPAVFGAATIPVLRAQRSETAQRPHP